MEAEVGGDHSGVIELVREAVRAGAYRGLARIFPASAGGFDKLAGKQSARVAALADEICGQATREIATCPSRKPGSRAT